MANLILVQDIVWDGTVSRGGHTMCELQWLRGLERLGHRVLFLDFVGHDFGAQRSAMLQAFGHVIDDWWHPELTALVDTSSMQSLYGLSLGEISRYADEAAAVITTCPLGRRQPSSLVAKVRPRLLVDRDPVYSQSWVVGGLDAADIYGEHDLYFTVGANIGTSRCSVPTFGIKWKPIWNPTLLAWWDADVPITNDHFTTVADWYSQAYIEFNGEILGPKVEEFRKFIDLPALAGEALELSLLISPDDPDINKLKAHGWRIESPERVRTAAMYREYLTGSVGEFSCAKGGYARTRCGWFSDRSQCYLAAGRPVVLQATGFEDVLPTGGGLFSFATPGEAAEALRAIRRDYALHSKAARALAVEHFDSDRVLSQLLTEAGIRSYIRRG